jgi:hypothetical protein
MTLSEHHRFPLRSICFHELKALCDCGSYEHLLAPLQVGARSGAGLAQEAQCLGITQLLQQCLNFDWPSLVSVYLKYCLSAIQTISPHRPELRF